MTNYDRLRRLLAELFQFDQADLDFGIYRIMNRKRDEISRFLDQDLLPQVRETLEQHQSTVSDAGQQELQEAVQQAQALGVDPDTVPRVQELKARLGPVQDSAALEEEVFSHLCDFFRRYYSEGDFISQRRYREGVYAIPYEGEEVKLHWANHDQYYVKSSENFRNYTFRLPDGRKVHFRIVEAATGRDNNRPQDDKNRRFMLLTEGAGEPENGGTGETAEDTPGDLSLEFEESADASQDPTLPPSQAPAVEVLNGDLVVRFVFLPDTQKRRQDAINAETAEAILGTPGIEDWLAGLRTPAPTDKNGDRTLLERHLDTYTRRNTFDYFIHKDLGGFLRRELDFFIKNEIMHLDDIEGETAPRVEQYLGKLRALRRVAGKIITFLAQLEDFQKKLWLKKKFVVETNYCVTLDRVPEELWPEVFANRTQREEWQRLFDVSAEGERPEPFSAHLVVDTAHFPQEFKDRLLQALDDLDEQMDGLLVHGENFQALSVLRSRYERNIECVYIDPPYNTSGSEIVYKNEYKHSCWLSLIANRLDVSRYLMTEATIQCTAIDDTESSFLHQLLRMTFGQANYLATVPIRSKPQGRAVPTGFSPNHEYAVFFRVSDAAAVGRLPRDEVRMARYPERDEHGIFAWANFRGTGANSWRRNRPRLFYAIYISPDGDIFIPDYEWDAETDAWRPTTIPEDYEALLPVDEDGTERVWSLGWERARNQRTDLLQARKVQGSWQVFRKYRPHQEGALPGTWWGDPKYSASESGTKVLDDLVGANGGFSYPKSIHAVIDCLRACNLQPGQVALDYFAGSGTTAHAVINLNREDGGNRKYILVEMGEYFDTVLLPRIKKVAYSKDWRDGKPLSREGSSHLLKYIRLESYEDTLENLELVRTPEQQRTLEDGMSPEAREEYLLSYMLDTESRGSQSLLNLEAFRNPFGYRLKVATGIAGETREVDVDLVETFNYLIGLRVRHIDRIRGVRVVDGTSPAGERVLVLWRDVDEVDNDALDEWFKRQGYNTRDLEYDVIYVNGDNNLENLRRADQTWKVRLIEADFHRLMFDVQDV